MQRDIEFQKLLESGKFNDAIDLLKNHCDQHTIRFALMSAFHAGVLSGYEYGCNISNRIDDTTD